MPRSLKIKRAACKKGEPRQSQKNDRIRRVAVLGSGKVLEQDPLYQKAVRLGQALAEEGFSVCHGGYRGVMEAVAKGSRLSGGQNTGITIRFKPKPGFKISKSLALKRVNPWANAEIKMPGWQSRLFKLIEMGDAYVFLDGATGTLAELFVVLEMTNRGLLAKPIIILSKRLHKLLKFLKTDPLLEIPKNFHLASSIAQVISILNKQS